MRLMDGAGGSDIEAKSPHTGSWADVYALPSLPTPDFCAMRSEACCGNSLVCFLIFLFVAPMQAAREQPRTLITQQCGSGCSPSTRRPHARSYACSA